MVRAGRGRTQRPLWCCWLMAVQDLRGMGFAWNLITSEGCFVSFLSAVCVKRCRLVTAGPGNVTVWSVLISGFFFFFFFLISGFSCVYPGDAFLGSLLLKLLFCGSEWSNTSFGVASEHYKFQRALFCGHWVEWLLQCFSFLGYLRALSGPRCF